MWEEQFKFGRCQGWQSVIFNDTLRWICERYRHLLEWHPSVDLARIRQFAEVIEKFGGGGKIWGFIDGTFRGFCRPTLRQKLYYTGHKKRHGMKYQGIVTPDGLIVHFGGPFKGRLNDITMLRESGLEQKFEELYKDEQEGEFFVLFGDKAYISLVRILSPFPRKHIEPHERQWNRRMEQARVAVENAFGQIQQKWTAQAFHIALRARSMPLAHYAEVAALLTNCYTCIEGNQIGNRFDPAANPRRISRWGRMMGPRYCE
jgi:hypothetical protein